MFVFINFMIYICSQNDIIMNTPSPKKATMLRLNVQLVEQLKQLARKDNRSLNNYIECLLINAVNEQPNKLTKEAIEEARSGKLKNATPVDTSSVDAMLKSLDL